MKFIQLYHGSSFKFDKFSEKFFGKGEGGQEYGNSFYFIDNKEGAEYYAKKVKNELKLNESYVYNVEVGYEKILNLNLNKKSSKWFISDILDILNNETKKLIEKYDEKEYRILGDNIRSVMSGDTIKYLQKEIIKEVYRKIEKDIRDYYDGVEYMRKDVDGNLYAIFSSNNIKIKSCETIK